MIGRIYLIVGVAYAVVLAIATTFTAGDAFEVAFVLFLPVFAVIGSMGALMVFTNDRVKGVFEYLIAYGVPPRRLFGNVLAAGLVLAAIVLGASLTIGLGAYVATGNTITAQLAELLGLYSLPMSFASVAFAATIGMFWTTLSSPRTGMNSPVGLIPLIGIAPSLVTLAAVIGLAVTGSTSFFGVTTVAVVLLAATVLLLLRQIGRLLPLERLLSPA